MIESGPATIRGISSKESTEKQTGIHIRFSQTVEGNASEMHKSANHRERHGKLGLKIGGKMFTFTGKLTANTVYAEKINENTTTNYTFVPSERMSSEWFADIYDELGEIVDFSFEDAQKDMTDKMKDKEPVAAATDL